MKLTNDFRLTILGVGALALMLGLNIRHALNNYGITDGNLHMEILAQSNSSGGGSGSGSSSGSGGGSDNYGGSSSGNHCPDYSYVPNRYIVHSVQTITVTSNIKGEINVAGTVQSGFEKNKQIVIAIQISNCDGIQENSCCNQSNTGVRIL
ncbi:MAG: hypothetical protein LBG28_02555 [Tannerella sp.]|jgi:hypothetical protein|nr:hypothetical protein [Tannerella sp.]